MAMVCTVCTHFDREAIDRALLEGSPIRRIAADYGVSESAVRRHKNTHLPAKLAKAQEAADIASADRLLSELKALKAKAVSLLMAAEKAGDFRTALAGVREARACIETLLELEGELDRRAQVNVLVANPEWLQVRTALLEALGPFPEARKAVVDAIGAGHALQ